jgi:hypothetical protein
MFPVRRFLEQEDRRMTNRKSVVAVGLAVLVAIGIATTVHGWTGQQNTLKFSGAVALPGVVLPAGSYRFLVMEGGSGDIVRVTSDDGRQPYFMGFTRTVQRPHSHDSKRAIVLGERAAGTPPPIAIWFPTDGGNGHEFIY